MSADGPDGGIQDRFAAHVAAVLARSGIPKRDRADVAEELLGHLTERHAALMATGLSADAAVDEALRGFGGAAEVGAAFVTAYHSRLWASTIGALLPVDADTAGPPGPVVWTMRLFRLLALFSIVGAAAVLLLSPPVRALVGAALALAGAASLALTAEGLRRRQAWTVGLTLLVFVIEIVTFVVSLQPPGGGWSVNLFGVAAAILLAAWLFEDRSIARWMTGTGPVRRTLMVAMAIALVGWGLAGVAASRLPDPTQIGPEDIEAVASVTCAPVELEDGTSTVPVPTVTVDVIYHRADLWPAGILRQDAEIGDPIGVDLTSANAQLLAGGVVDTGTGETAGSWVIGGMNPAIDDSQVATTIPLSMQRAGHPLRVMVSGTSDIVDGRSDAGTPLPGTAIDVRLGHLDRFVLEAELQCGERRALVAGSG